MIIIFYNDYLDMYLFFYIASTGRLDSFVRSELSGRSFLSRNLILLGLCGKAKHKICFIIKEDGKTNC